MLSAWFICILTLNLCECFPLLSSEKQKYNTLINNIYIFYHLREQIWMRMIPFLNPTSISLQTYAFVSVSHPEVTERLLRKVSNITRTDSWNI